MRTSLQYNFRGGRNSCVWGPSVALQTLSAVVSESSCDTADSRPFDERVCWMLGSKPAAVAPLALALLACHALGLLSEMTVQAFTLASGSGSSSSSGSRHRHHRQRAELKKRTRYRSRTVAALWSVPQEGNPDGDAWWEGDIDPWTEAENRVSVWGMGTRASTRACVAGHAL